MNQAIYHNDPDGMTSFVVLSEALDREVVGTPVTHDKVDVEVKSGCTLYILDFSPPTAEHLRQWLQQADEVVFIDHHKSSADYLPLLEEYQAKIYYDEDSAACQLTWDVFYMEDPYPNLVNYVADRDLWKWSLPSSREISAAISITPLKYDEYYKLLTSFDAFSLNSQGSAILASQTQYVNSIVHRENVRWLRLGEYNVPAIVSSYIHSEIGEALGKLYPQAPFVVVVVPNRKSRIELRCPMDDLNLAEIAAKYGGGGHRKAAAFHVESVDILQNEIRI